jgi:hypothetical protein
MYYRAFYVDKDCKVKLVVLQYPIDFLIKKKQGGQDEKTAFYSFDLSALFYLQLPKQGSDGRA